MIIRGKERQNESCAPRAPVGDVKDALIGVDEEKPGKAVLPRERSFTDAQPRQRSLLSGAEPPTPVMSPASEFFDVGTGRRRTKTSETEEEKEVGVRGQALRGMLRQGKMIQGLNINNYF